MITSLDQLDTNPTNDVADVAFTAVSVNRDGDACSDFLEGLLGTDPLVAGDCPRITIHPSADQSVRVEFHSLTGLTFEVETTTNLYNPSSWMSIGMTNGLQPITTFTDTNAWFSSGSRRYYRVRYPSPPF